ncbi:MAG TPA: nitrilase-related carbon-nitrogen hydrolase [Rubrobacter sp.]|nr:nitrilase-related carbon-nitrogen hydrolase [Rubrobacter sp.]
MPGALDIALAQLTPAVRDTAKNLGTITRLVEENADADLIIFPELFLGGYTTREPEELALDLDGPEVESLAGAAREHSTAVILGAPERLIEGISNSAICVDERGEIAGSYRKTHLFGDERGVFVAGNELLVLELGGLKAGLMICFDVEFPEVARSLALAGADLLVTISANMDPFGRDHDVFATARALENGLPHLYVNQVGHGEAFTFAGGSMAVSADGDRLAEAGTSGEAVARLRLDTAVGNPARPKELKPDYLRERRGMLPVDAPRVPEQR